MTLTEDILNRLLWQAFAECSRDDSDFGFNAEGEMLDLLHDLTHRCWTPSPMECFMVTDPMREVFCPATRDVVVSHLLFSMLNPLVEKALINDCYSCRKGRGTGYGLKRFGHYLRSVTQNWTRDAYVLKMDISGYFMSIDRRTVLAMFRELLDKYRDRDSGNGKKWCETLDFEFILYVLERVLSNDPCRTAVRRGWPKKWEGYPKNKSFFYASPWHGIVIGDVLSQLIGNISLNPLDQFVKRTLKEQAYGRYVDDFFIMSTDKERLKKDQKRIEAFLDGYGIQLNRKKTKIIPTHCGVEFLGHVFRPFRVSVTRRTAKRFRGSCRTMVCLLEKGDDIGAFLHLRRSLVSYVKYIGERAQNTIIKSLRKGRSKESVLRHVHCSRTTLNKWLRALPDDVLVSLERRRR